MSRPVGVKTKLIVERDKIEDGGHWRDRFKLECGHTIIRAMRKGRPDRIVCLKCNP